MRLKNELLRVIFVNFQEKNKTKIIEEKNNESQTRYFFSFISSGEFFEFEFSFDFERRNPNMKIFLTDICICICKLNR